MLQTKEIFRTKGSYFALVYLISAAQFLYILFSLSQTVSVEQTGYG
jgi:hypothetical protein